MIKLQYMGEQYNGYVTVPHGTYDEFRNAVNGNGYDVDGAYGDQCVDLAKLLWYQYGQTFETGNGYAYGSWTIARAQNLGTNFEAVYNLSDVKRGDMIIWNTGVYGRITGHNGFADEDYVAGMTTIRTLGQNQTGIPYEGGGAYTNIANFTTSYFLGAFRNKNWTSIPPSPPEPPVIRHKSHFSWVVFARTLRKRRGMLY